MNFNTILQECIHAVSLIYIPFFLKWKMKVMNVLLREWRNWQKKSMSAIAHVPHTLYQIQSYAETRCCQDFWEFAKRQKQTHADIELFIGVIMMFVCFECMLKYFIWWKKMVFLSRASENYNVGLIINSLRKKWKTKYFCSIQQKIYWNLIK